MQHRRLILSVGFAVFAMFFGAGNLVFPLDVGAHAGNYMLLAAFGFLLSGVIVPFLGLFAISLYNGDYLAFLKNIGEIPAFIVSLILIALIGIFTANPRCSILAFHTMGGFLPQSHLAMVIFNAIFFACIYFANVKKDLIINLLAYVLSPLKLFLLFTIIFLGFLHFGHRQTLSLSPSFVFMHALHAGYGTMDLLAAFFFCAFVYRVIQQKTRHTSMSPEQIRHLTLSACLIGAGLLAIVYIGFLCVADLHGQALQGVPTQGMIAAIARDILDSYAALFVGVCVTLACFSTSLAITAVTVEFIQNKVFMARVPYHAVLVGTVLAVFLMSNLGFKTIMAIAMPILQSLYPALLVLTISNILFKVKGWRLGAWPFYVVLVLAIAALFL